ncbi:MAG: SRPBCC family protein [Planctomycetota bacterium]
MHRWACEQEAVTKATRQMVWEFWTDLRNHELEPGVERIELDGPFETGAVGRTVTAHGTHEWALVDVVQHTRFAIVGQTPDESGSLSFAWELAEHPHGTHITYRIRADGPQVPDSMDILRGMEERAPAALEQLVAWLDALPPRAAQPPVAPPTPGPGTA